MRRGLFFFGVSSTALSIACGIGVVGSKEADEVSGEASASTESGNPIVDANIDEGSGDVASEAAFDAGRQATCEMLCPGAGGTCDSDGVCNIACDGMNACPSRVDCPDGVDCHVRCTSPNACLGGVSCGKGAKCEIDCTKPNACQGTLDCTAGAGDNGATAISRCSIVCAEPNSCTGIISTKANTSIVVCGAANACNQIRCGGGVCGLSSAAGGAVDARCCAPASSCLGTEWDQTNATNCF